MTIKMLDQRVRAGHGALGVMFFAVIAGFAAGGVTDAMGAAPASGARSPTLAAPGVAPGVAISSPSPDVAKTQSASTPRAERPLRVVVSIPPLKGLVEPLLPAGSTVELLLPPGVSEHGYEIPPGKLAAMAKADLVVFVGMGMEPQVEKSLAKNAMPGRRVIKFESVPGVMATSKPRPQANDEHDDHSGHAHDERGHCVHESDPHVWLDPLMAMSLVDEVARELAERRLSGADAGGAGGVPGAMNAAEIKAAASAQIERDPVVVNLRNRLLELHRRAQAITQRPARRTIVVAHDAFGWLAQRYKLDVVAISGLAAGEPKPEAIRDAVRVIREKSLTTIFVEPQLSTASAKRVAQLTGAKIDTLDPLGDGDYFKLMNANLDALARALGEAAAPTAAPAHSPAPSLQPAPAKK